VESRYSRGTRAATAVKVASANVMASELGFCASVDWPILRNTSFAEASEGTVAAVRMVARKIAGRIEREDQLLRGETRYHVD
jgi:hypothetical protein